MITKNIQVLGEDLVKKLTGVSFEKKDTTTDHPTAYPDDLKLLHQLQLLRLEMEMQQEQKPVDQISLDEINRRQTELFEFSPDGYFALNMIGIIQEVNATGANLMGMAGNELTNQLFLNYITAEDQETFRTCWHHLMNTNDNQVLKATVLKPDGYRIFVRITLTGTWIDEEFFVLLSMTDMTMWKQQKQSLKEAEEKYRTVADYTYNWETWINPAGEFIYVSPSCKRISGYTVEEFMQDPALLTRITHPEDRHIVEEHFDKAIKGEVHNGSFEFRIISRDGHERWIGHHSQPVFDSRGNFMGQRGSNQDITQRKVAEKILLDSQKHLRQLSQRMEEITEAERTRIAREIHDELGHLLSALKYDMEGLVNHSDLSAEHLKNELEVMVDMVDSLIDSVRKIATELRPGILDHLGLFPAIEWQLKQFRLRTRICCSFSMQEMEISFDKNETNIIFRILQEILTNITRHAEATHVSVLLSKTDTHFLMEVTDDGIGFQYNDYLQVTTLGLIGMKERALSIGGEIQINSKPGKGTIVRFLLPRS